MIPALRDAPFDPELKARDVQVLLALVEELDLVAFQVVKEAALRHRLRLGRATLWRSLSSLCAAGYLERSIPRPGACAAYRLNYRVSKLKRTDAA